MAPLVSGIPVRESELRTIGFQGEVQKNIEKLDFALLQHFYENTPGLVSDKLKAVLKLVWDCLKETPCRGIVLAYDEAQNLSDQATDRQFPLSLLLDIFQSIQKSGMPYLLVLTGLPTLFPKLVEARTFAERMFHVMTLERLDDSACEDAIRKPIEDQSCPVKFTKTRVGEIILHSGGYPYFVQFLCREFFNTYIQQLTSGQQKPNVKVRQMIGKLDTDFFAGRWHRVTDRQRELLHVVAQLDHCDEEFSPADVVEKSKEMLARPFGPSQVNQILVKLSESGLVYKNRHGKYSFAVPLLGQFIRRQYDSRGEDSLF